MADPFYILDMSNLSAVADRFNDVINKYNISDVSSSIYDAPLYNKYDGPAPEQKKSRFLKKQRKAREKNIERLKLNRTRAQADVRDKIVKLDLADPKQAAKARLVAPEKLATTNVKRSVHDIKKKSVLAGKALRKWFTSNEQLNHNVKSIMSKMGKKEGLIVGSAVVLGMFTLSRVANGGARGRNKMGLNPSKNILSNRASYMPQSYKQGFDDMKRLTTDFGSKVHLDRTTSKVMVTPRNSTRNGSVTSTNSIMNSNASLLMSKNAINHTRY